MCSVQEMQQVDRELSLKLTEFLTNLALLRLCLPIIEGSDPLSCPQMNGEVLWQVRDFRTLHEIFRNLHVSLVKLGYKLASSCGHRVGLTVYRRVKHLMDKSRAMTNNESRKAMRSSYWCKVSLRPDEMRRHSAPRKER